MQKEPKAIWEDCKAIIESHLNPKSFSTWFKPIKALKIENNVLTIQVPSSYFYDYIEANYINVLKKTLYEVLGPQGKLEYSFVAEKKNDNNSDKILPKDIKNPFVIPGIKKKKIASNLNSKYSFDNYLQGDCNNVARSAGINISTNNLGTIFNPLVIYGDVGLGKTHLAHAIGNGILENHKDLNVLYITTEEFTNQIVSSIRNNSIDDFLNYFNFVDTLIVDDIQFLSNRDKTQDIFFNIFNKLHQNDKQIILTSDRPVKDMEGVKDRLINRFKWGLTTDLKSPDFETRVAIVQQKLGKDLEKIPKNVLEYICFNIKSNIRELEGVIISLMAQANLNNKEINVELAKEVIDKFVTRLNKDITVENIANMVADHLKVSVDKMRGKTRKRDVVIARQLSMFLAKTYTDNSLKDIGKNFGGRDHSTVIYSVRAVQDLLDTDALFKEQVTELEKKVRLSLIG